MRSPLLILIFTLLLFGTSVFSKSCSEDYECNIPFGTCMDSSDSSSNSTDSQDTCFLLKGFGLDEQMSKLYFAGRCNFDKALPEITGEVYIFSSNLDGSSITRITQVHENRSVEAYSAFERFLEVSKNSFYVIKNEPRILEVHAIDRSFYEDTSVVGYRNSDFNIYLDNANEDTYTCYNNQIYRYNDLVTQEIDSYSDAYIIYNSTETNFTFCADVAVVGEDLYILTLSTDNSGRSFVWRGNTLGTKELELYLTIYGQTLFFDATSTAIYYAVDHFLYRHFFDPQPLPTQLTTERGPFVQFNSIESFGGFVYYNNGTHIRRVNEDTLNTETVIPDTFSVQSSTSDSTQSSSGKTCKCRPGFSGDDCTQCATTVQWNDGLPSCPDLDSENNLPVSCSADYQCGNAPFTRCAEGKCECATGFTGPLCTSCDNGQIQWNAGLPECILILDSGLPASCSADYQCGNVPFTKCSEGKCECATGFSGQSCASCVDGQISFENGIPVCQK